MRFTPPEIEIIIGQDSVSDADAIALVLHKHEAMTGRAPDPIESEDYRLDVIRIMAMRCDEAIYGADPEPFYAGGALRDHLRGRVKFDREEENDDATGQDARAYRHTKDPG